MINNARDLSRLKDRHEEKRAREKMRISVCAGTGCVASGSLEVLESLRRELEAHDLNVEVTAVKDGCGDRVGLSQSGCHGFCQMGPLVRIDPHDNLMVKVKPEDVPEIVRACVLQEGTVPEHNLYHHPQTEEVYAKASDIPFYSLQKRVTLEHCGHIDPSDIEEYVYTGGYSSLGDVLENYSPEELCQLITESGMRGRGGGGFPTGTKWDLTRKADGHKKYVVCNGDEGDPGAFMDRSIMEGDPHRLVEGMIIAGYAIGADEGLIYVRAEYPLAIDRLKEAIESARKVNLLGDDIMGSGFSFNIRISKGAGAFVCGEETALLASIEGNRGLPTSRPPYPSDKGLFGNPTLINNVETLATVPSILAMGAKEYRSIGTESSPGTKTFAITGEIANTGLIEVPMGTSLREIVYEIGGGLRSGGDFKAVQIGGPSGGCLTREHLDLPLDFDSLAGVGAMIGSGGLVVMDDSTCMVEVARFFLNFTQDESCGKCTPCRIGTRQMLDILIRITEGSGTMEDLTKLESLGDLVKSTSLCGLGKTAPNPILTTLEYFRDEYEAHVVDKTCPSRRCKNLIGAYVINPEVCIGCGRCVPVCPVDAISGEFRDTHEIDPEICIVCGACADVCPVEAIR